MFTRVIVSAVRSLPRTGAEELAAGSDLAAGDEARAVVDFVWSAEAETAAWAVIEAGGDGVAVRLGEMAERRALGEILADEAVGVLVGAAFPGLMGSGEVDGSMERLLERLVAVELDSIVRGDGADGMRFVGEEFDQLGVGVDDGGAGERGEAEKAALALDGGDDAGLALAMNGVGLPVAEAGTRGDHGWSIGDHAFTREPATAVLAGVALAPPLVGAAEVTPQRAAARLVRPDVQVERLGAHHPDPLDTQPADNLLGAEVRAQHRLDRREVFGGVAFVPAGAPPSTVGLLHREHRAVEAIVRTSVASDLAMDGTAMPVEGDRDLLDRLPLASHCCDRVSFFCA